MTANPVVLDPVIHAPIRLQICAMLSNALRVEFRALRDELQVSDSVLSKHIKQLEQARYVSQAKDSFAGRNLTWVAMTDDGRQAFDGYVAQLNRVVGKLGSD